ERARFAAVVAGVAGAGEIFAEVAQLYRAPTFAGLRVAHDLAQLLARHALFLEERLAAQRIDFLLDQKVRGADVAGAEVQDTARAVAVAPGTPRLLVITLERPGQIVMHHPAHVRLVDTHAEGDGGDHDLRIVANERFLVDAPRLGIEPCMIGQGADA